MARKPGEIYREEYKQEFISQINKGNIETGQKPYSEKHIHLKRNSKKTSTTSLQMKF